MKHPTVRLLLPSLALSLLAASLHAQDVPDVARDEILRRGDFVERLGRFQDDGQTAIAEALEPPADDSYKWFISVVTTRKCRYCDALKHDFATSPHLKPFVDTSDHARSWAHFNVFSVEDQTQSWRWKGIKLGGFPTLLVQPPRNGRFGDPQTVVLQKTGYDGDPAKLADAIRQAIAAYARRYAQSPQAGVHGEGESIGYDPPFSPPPRVEPAVPSPSPYPFDVPPAPAPVSPTPQPTDNALSLLAGLVGGMLTSGGLTNLLLVALSALAIIRTFRKATGQQLLLEDAAYQNLIDSLKSLLPSQSPPPPTASG
ncbi:MAG: hypothetical protein RIC55_02490 [Pirellulaceae bacterium]